MIIIIRQLCVLSVSVTNNKGNKSVGKSRRPVYTYFMRYLKYVGFTICLFLLGCEGPMPIDREEPPFQIARFRLVPNDQYIYQSTVNQINDQGDTVLYRIDTLITTVYGEEELPTTISAIKAETHVASDTNTLRIWYQNREDGLYQVAISGSNAVPVGTVLGKRISWSPFQGILEQTVTSADTCYSERLLIKYPIYPGLTWTIPGDDSCYMTVRHEIISELQYEYNQQIYPVLELQKTLLDFPEFNTLTTWLVSDQVVFRFYFETTMQRLDDTGSPTVDTLTYIQETHLIGSNRVF